MHDFMQIAQENYIRAEKQKAHSAKQIRTDPAAKALEKLVLASCLALLVVDAVMLITVICHQLTH